jgi:hypothetical protein
MNAELKQKVGVGYGRSGCGWCAFVEVDGVTVYVTSPPVETEAEVELVCAKLNDEVLRDYGEAGWERRLSVLFGGKQ